MAKEINNQKLKELLTRRGVAFVEKNHREAVGKLKTLQVWHKFLKNYGE